jgi:transposase
VIVCENDACRVRDYGRLENLPWMHERRIKNPNADTSLHKTKYLWLRSDANMTDKQRSALEALTCLELETAKVWAFKESLRQFFACTTEYGARSFFFSWHEAALALGNVHLTRVAQMLHRHLDGLWF